MTHAVTPSPNAATDRFVGYSADPSAGPYGVVRKRMAKNVTRSQYRVL